MTDSLVPVVRTISEAEALVACAALNAAGIRAVCFDHAQSTLRWDIQVIQPRLVYVRESDATAARDLLATETTHPASDDGDPSPRQRRARTGLIIVGVVLLLSAFVGSISPWWLSGLFGRAFGWW